MTRGGNGNGLTVIADGTVAAADPRRYSRNAPSFYADPAGWLVAAAVQEAFDGCAGEPLSVPDEVGVVAVSAACTAHTMGAIATSARDGLVSPLRFAGASPGILAGLACIRWKLRGPTLTLAMDPVAGLDVAATVAGGWLRDGQARYVLVAAYTVEDDQHVARCAVTRSRRTGEPDGRPRIRALVAGPVPVAAGR
ncbi:MAG: polyketide synthase [Actinobacteria bacterium]|nr:MAG: polyketide synthase [Actinomycetota bacterium]